uniref:Uncharacterized protein LOC105048391 n=1 Tax=Elaeis guineensis var. tenera TaxID=51953 RepID=A0A6I9RFT9_ELAGV|nr:uncharacterized protein LOC105048391 [Elaeis guineensis]
MRVEQSKIILYSDSQSTLQLAQNLIYHARTKHIDMRCHRIRELVEKGEVELVKIHTKENQSDVLMKGNIRKVSGLLGVESRYRGSDKFWVVHIDGSSSSARSGISFLLFGPEGFITEYALRFNFSATNNEAEYEALIVGLKIAKELGVQKLKIHTDSQLVAGQVKGDYEARGKNMKKYLLKIKDLVSTFSDFNILQVPPV